MEKFEPEHDSTTGTPVEVNAVVMHICSAYKSCHVKVCRHKARHECNEKGMHHFDVCNTSKMLSACLEIVDGKIPVQDWEKCPHCGHSERKVVYEDVVA